MPDTARANLEAARGLVGELFACGVRNVCVAPGSRSTPLVLAVAECDKLRDWIVHDERGGAYFALGMARELNEPVAIVSTSGTAAANFLPAVVEASLSCVPLIVLTADRPSELRGFGAPQTIDQVHIYGSHVRWDFDVAPPCGHRTEPASMRAIGCRAVAEATVAPAGPVHLNLCYREPLIDSAGGRAPKAAEEPAPTRPFLRVHREVPALHPQTIQELADAMATAKRGLIVCGPRTSGSEPSHASADTVSRLAAGLRWPILADVLSGLRFGDHDVSRVVPAHDLLLGEHGFAKRSRPDFVVQFGSPPVSKNTQRWLADLHDARHVLIAEPGLWPDPEHAATDLIHATTSQFCESILRGLAETGAPATPASLADAEWAESWMRAGRLAHDAAYEELARLAGADAEGPAAAAGPAAAGGSAAAKHDQRNGAREAAAPGLCEAAVPAVVAEALPERAGLSVGNSMPVRDLDSLAAPSAKRIRVLCNRGANGIDGVVSASLGAAAVSRAPVALVIGDLSFLHDVSALQLAARLEISMSIVVVNNDGGGVFSFLPQADREDIFERYFATPHGLDLQPIASSCGARYTRAGRADSLTEQLRAAVKRHGLDIIEVPSTRTANREQHRSVAEAVCRALHDAFGEAA